MCGNCVVLHCKCCSGEWSLTTASNSLKLSLLPYTLPGRPSHAGDVTIERCNSPTHMIIPLVGRSTYQIITSATLITNHTDEIYVSKPLRLSLVPWMRILCQATRLRWTLYDLTTTPSLDQIWEILLPVITSSWNLIRFVKSYGKHWSNSRNTYQPNLGWVAQEIGRKNNSMQVKN